MPATHPAPGPACPTADVVRRFALSIAGLLSLIRQVFPRVPNPPVSSLEILNYISRTRRRFERLLARLAAGIAPRARAPRPDDAAEPKPRATPRFRLPRRRLWLRAILGHNAGNFAGQVAYLLDQPETAALIAASPQAQRLLRPFFHILGTPPACIPPLPKRPRKPRPKPAPKPRRLSYKQRQALLWYPNIEGRPMKLLPSRAALAREPPAYLTAALLPVAKKPA
jgi:hypothetical protein